MNARIAFASQAPTAVEDEGQYKRHAVLGVANDLRGAMGLAAGASQ